MKRHTYELFTPPGIVSWDAQYNHAVKLISDGGSVILHRHGCNVPCPSGDDLSPNGGCLEGGLTSSDESPSLVPISTTD